MALPNIPDVKIIPKTKICEYCRSKLKSDATICKYCGAPVKKS